MSLEQNSDWQEHVDQGLSGSDMLASIFSMQADLNDHVFLKNHIRDAAGQQLSMRSIAQETNSGRLSVNDLPNQWLVKYAQAMESELEELKEDLLWKWWSKDKIDLQNVRVELVDVLHFLVSAMISAGLSPEKLYDIYKQKHAANIARQDAGYSMQTKTEEDNKRIQ